MNMTQEELENGFSRQVYLYSGLGFEKMKEIIEKQFPNKKIPKPCVHDWEQNMRYDNVFSCKVCGEEKSFLPKH